MTFRDLIDKHYVAVGFTLTQALAKVNLDTRVSLSSLRAAYHGTRVHITTATRLHNWAKTTHKEQIKVLQMVGAPPKRSNVDRQR